MTWLPGRRTVASALAIGVAALAGTAYAGTPDSGRHHERTIELVEVTKTPHPDSVDLGTPGPSPGDLVVIRDHVAHPNGQLAGAMRQVCTLIEPGARPMTGSFECVGSLELEDGTITVAGPFDPTLPVQAQAVTGGTGAYKAARGEVSIRAEADELTVTLVR